MTQPTNAVGFCHEGSRHEAIGAHLSATIEGPKAMTEAVVAALREVYDPEIPLNIYDLGLVYRIAVNAEGDVGVEMTLTSPSCPVAGMMPLMVKNAVGGVDGVGLIDVEMVWEPPWSPDHLSEAARLDLGLL